MTTMLERAARAVKAIRDDQCATAEDIARAVLMAVREPDEAMKEAWADAEDWNDHPTEVHLNERRFAAMIDAILNEKDTTND